MKDVPLMPAALKRLMVFALAALLAACAAPQRPAAPTGELSMEEGINFVVDDLLTQARQLPQFERGKVILNKVIRAIDFANPNRGAGGKPVVVLDAVVDGVSGQQTTTTRLLDSRLLQRATANFDQFEIVQVGSDPLRRAQFVTTGSLTITGRAGGFTSYRINLSLTELSSGTVVAQSVALVRAKGVDATPTGFFRDSPSLTKDQVIDAQIRTAQAPVGTTADKVYLARLPVSALVSDAARYYEAGDYPQALRHYETAAERTDGKQMRVLVGIYLSQMQLGRTEAAAAAFSRIVALGLATNNLSVKFLFRAGSVDFINDAKISAPYAMWLKALATELVASKSCLLIVGHTSRTGSEAFNDKLSQLRAASIQKRLEDLAPETVGRFQLSGMGFRENLIGSGTDDQQDSLDRRVEFKVRSCG